MGSTSGARPSACGRTSRLTRVYNVRRWEEGGRREWGVCRGGICDGGGGSEGADTGGGGGEGGGLWVCEALN